MNFLLPALALLVVAMFAAQAFNRREGRGHASRWDLALDALNTVVALAAARLLIAWGEVPPWVWLLFVAAFAVGAVGAVRRWPDLPWFRPVRSVRRSVAWGSVNIVILAGIVLLFVV